MPVTIDRALSDRHLFGAAIGGDLTSWSTWRATLKAAFGVSLDAEQRKVFAAIAGNRDPPSRRVRELWAIIGRRGGKSRMAALIASYLALFSRYHLARGETGYILVLAATVAQAKVVFEYIVGLLSASVLLRREVRSIRAGEIKMRNGIRIAVHSNSFRSIRGRTLLACIFDECSFWRDETSATPDIEVYRAILPALATTRGMLIGISTPYRKLGLLYQKHRDHFGQPGDDVLVVQGDSLTFNPNLDAELISAASAADPGAALSEWEGLFRADIAAFLDDDLIERAVDHGRPLELPPRQGVRYAAFADASGGRHDHYVLAVAHAEGERVVVDVVRGRAPPFDPQEVTKEFAALAQEYGVNTVTGDNYSAAWVESAWASAGVRYKRSELNRSDLYLNALPSFTRGALSLPDHARALRELRLLERRASRGGRDMVDHGRNGSDDYANALCGAVSLVSSRKATMKIPDRVLQWARMPAGSPWPAPSHNPAPHDFSVTDSISVSDAVERRRLQ